MPRQPQPKKTEEEHKNPLLEDTRASFAPAPGWITPAPEVQEPTPPPAVIEQQPETPVQPAQSTPPTPQEPPLLYKSKPSAEWLMRPFDRQYDKQAASVNPYQAGAVDAILRLKKMTKQELVEYLYGKFIEENASLLEENEELVRRYEQKYRDKHHL